MSSTLQGTTQSQMRVTLSVNGHDFGAWDKKTGGAYDTNPQTYNPADYPQLALKGLPTTSAIVLSRIYDLQRDQPFMPLLYRLAKNAGSAVVKEFGLDADGNTFAGATVTTGILTNVTRPDGDSTSSSPAMLSVTITVSGEPTASYPGASS